MQERKKKYVLGSKKLLHSLDFFFLTFVLEKFYFSSKKTALCVDL